MVFQYFIVNWGRESTKQRFVEIAEDGDVASSGLCACQSVSRYNFMIEETCKFSTHNAKFTSVISMILLRRTNFLAECPTTAVQAAIGQWRNRFTSRTRLEGWSSQSDESPWVWTSIDINFLNFQESEFRTIQTVLMCIWMRFLSTFNVSVVLRQSPLPQWQQVLWLSLINLYNKYSKNHISA